MFSLTEVKRLYVIIMLLLFCWAGGFVCAAVSSGSDNLNSPYVASVFHDIGLEILDVRGATDEEVECAMVFLFAASELDGDSTYIKETILRTSSLLYDDKYDKSVRQAFDEYVGRDMDLEAARKAVSHFLAGLNSREERQEALAGLLSKVGGRNSKLSSELSMQLGLLNAEKADFSMSSAAVTYLRNAVRDDMYNFRAFSSLDEILKNAGEAMSPSMYARYLRLKMTSEPMNFGSALRFAQYAEYAGMYDIASEAYEYSVKLYKHLNGESAFEVSIYLPWALSSYHSQRHKGKCLEILDEVRKEGVFDIMIEAIAGRAAAKMSNPGLAGQILLNAGRVAEAKWESQGDVLLAVTDIQVAWFYNFVSPDSTKAMVWANKAYSNNSGSVDVKAMLSYAMVVSSISDDDGKLKLETARAFLGKGKDKPLYKCNQIAAVAMGLVQFREGNSKGATETLRMAIEMDELSFAAERAIELLKELGLTYESWAEPESIAKTLETTFPDGVVPEFAIEEEIISAKVSMANSDVAYGLEPGASLVIANDWTEPLMISDDGLFKGYIRVDAEVRGDVEANIYELISKRICPSSPVKAGGQLTVPLKLMTGSLRRILQAYPQASVEIKITVYLDPVVDQEGNMTTSINGVSPIVKIIKRRGVNLSKQYLMESLTKLSKGDFKERAHAGRFFTGLFSEQYVNTGLQSRYRYISVERPLVISAIRKNLDDDDWAVKAAGIYCLLDFRPPMDFQITQEVSQGLNAPQWPVRMAALYMLYKTQDDTFMRVVDWKTKSDENMNVRRLGEVLVGSQENK